MPKIFEYKQELQDQDLDGTYEHLHHAGALRLLEAARLRLMEVIGCSQEQLISLGILPVITRIHIDYKREVCKGSTVTTCEAAELTEKSMILSQKIFNSRGKEAVSAQVWSMFMSAQSRRAVPLPEGLVQGISNFYHF